MKRPYILLTLLMVSTTRLLAVHQPSARVWAKFQYVDSLKAHPSWLYGYSIEARFKDQPGLFYEGILQAQGGYQLFENTRIWVGHSVLSVTEVKAHHRISTYPNCFYQQIEQSIAKGANHNVNTRFRIEERFQISDNHTRLRYRQLLVWAMPILKIKSEYTPFVSEEVFFNCNSPLLKDQKFFNQNHLMLGVAFACAKDYTCQLAYLNQYQLLAATALHQSNHGLFVSMVF